MILLTRAKIKIVKRKIEGKPLAVSPPAVCCGLECPCAEDLAAYIDGVLPHSRYRVVGEHLAFCPHCFAVYIDVLQFQFEEEAGP